ncbi:MAG TPA: hypothetical protein VG604_01025 [Candidatus Saccharimonadales bacterium]|nr:hypothetical protein [Candidatus Saccharimonadales bacterium]
MSVENTAKAYAQNKLQGLVQDQLTDYAKEQLRDVATDQAKALGHSALDHALHGNREMTPEQSAQLTDDQHPEAGPGDSRDALTDTSLQVEPVDEINAGIETLEADAGAGKIADLRKEEAARKQLVEAETEAINEVASREGSTANVLKEASEAEQTDEVTQAREATAKALGDAKAEQIEEEAAEQALKDSKLETAGKTHEIAHKVFKGEKVSDNDAAQFDSKNEPEDIDDIRKDVAEAEADSGTTQERMNQAGHIVEEYLDSLGVKADADQLEVQMAADHRGELGDSKQLEAAMEEEAGKLITEAIVDGKGATNEMYEKIAELPKDQLQPVAEAADDQRRNGSVTDRTERQAAEALAKTANKDLNLAA